MTQTQIKKAVKILRSGGLVAFPTETVYGLGADAMNATAVEKVFQVKERPHNHPLIVHIADITQLGDWASEISDDALRLAEHFWPGPLTLVLKRKRTVLGLVTGGQETVALRIPKHPVALALLQGFGGGLVGPSANIFTHLSPTTKQAVFEELDDAVDLILDGGECSVGVESTIVDMSHEVPCILRPGMISASEIEHVLHKNVKHHKEIATKTRAPGMHHLHYAPLTKVLLVGSVQLAETINELQKMKNADIAILAINPLPEALARSSKVHIVNMPRDAKAYAHSLYQTLRDIDHLNYQSIVIEMVPDEEQWTAIRDRLSKASGKTHDQYTIKE